MRVHIEREWLRRGWDIWLVDDRGPGPRVGRLDENGRIVEWEQLEPGVSLPDQPSLRLDEDVFEAIVRAAGKVTQATDATVEALADTRAVRDRLLTIVEQTVLP